MILDHEWVTAALEALQGLTEHSPGTASLGGLLLYILVRDGIPYYKRRRNGSHNPGTHLAERMLACEKTISKVKESCARTDERLKAQEKFNDRMEKHVANFYERFDKLAGMGTGSSLR